MIARLAAAAVALVLVIGGATACQPDPEPTPSGPVFATEDEAFAAAEETYRAYVDALNRVDLSDPETFEAVYAWTTGELNASDRKNYSAWHADGYAISGDASVAYVAPGDAKTSESPEVTLDACYDVSAVDVVDSSGQSLVSADRPDVQKLTVTLVSGRTPTGLAIESVSASETDLTC